MQKYIIMPDIDLEELDLTKIYYANTQIELDRAIHRMSAKTVGGQIMVYEIKQIFKLVENPKFAKYDVKPNGEILPA